MLSQSVLPNSNVVLIINSMMQFNKDKYDEFPERTKLGQERLNQTYQNDLDLLDVRLNPPKDGTLQQRWRMWKTWKETNRNLLDVEAKLRRDLLCKKTENEVGTLVQEIMDICRRELVSSRVIADLVHFICFEDKYTEVNQTFTDRIMLR